METTSQFFPLLVEYKRRPLFVPNHPLFSNQAAPLIKTLSFAKGGGALVTRDQLVPPLEVYPIPNFPAFCVPIRQPMFSSLNTIIKFVIASTETDVQSVPALFVFNTHIHLFELQYRKMQFGHLKHISYKSFGSSVIEIIIINQK